jgi:predicted AlkP superfamily phosphohydrolase/phosphomutase
MGTPRLVVIGWDGADPDLAFRWARAGELPNLARLMERGAWGALASTTPPATFPAWTSIFTGLGPGRHGITDFTRPVPGRHAIRFLSATDRHGETLWQRFDREGLRSVVAAVPGTHPPDPIRGAFVSGFDGPVTTGIDPSFVHPRSLWRERHEQLARFKFADVQELRIGPGWHEQALARLLVGLGEKASLVIDLASQIEPDLLVAVFGESDTVAHHFWRFHDSRSPRFDAGGSRLLGDAILRVYRSLDAWLARIVALAGPDAVIAVVSDHGFQGSATVGVHLNAALAEAGLLSWRGDARPVLPLGAIRDLALGALPATLQERLFRMAGGVPAATLESASRFAAIDFSRTQAVADEVDYAPGVRLCVRGRDANGTVLPGAGFLRVRDQVAECLSRLTHPVSGAPLVARVIPREDASHGGFARFAADLLIEPAVLDGYRVSYLRTQGPSSVPVMLIDPRTGFGAKGRGMDGVHRQHGIWVCAGPTVRAVGEIAGASAVDVLPTLLAATGLGIHAGLDGRTLAEILTVEATIETVRSTAPRAESRWYARAASRTIERRMRALGYLE